MNVAKILRTFGDCGVDYLLIGGMNFLLRHECDEDMIVCQLALPPEYRRLSRIDFLKRARDRGSRLDDQPS
jgi:hypothetical protein